MADLEIYKVDLDTPQPEGRRGESPRAAFTKYNDLIDALVSAIEMAGLYVSSTAPDNPVDYMQWVDISDDPAVLRRWDAGEDEWVEIGPVLRPLGTASERNTGTEEDQIPTNSDLGSAAYKEVGESPGNVMGPGAFGLGGQGSSADSADSTLVSGFWRDSNYQYDLDDPDNKTNTYFLKHKWDNNFGWDLGSRPSGGRLTYRWFRDGVLAGAEQILHSGNTVVDGNGFIKSASPTICLHDDRIETAGFSKETPAMIKLSTGTYQITGTSGLAQKGWYIETPQDRNGNKYFNIDWEQDATPQVDADGMVDEPQDVTLIIRTYERVWNPHTGTHDNGNPVDIDDRYVSLRFVEVRQEDGDPDDGLTDYSDPPAA